MLVLLVFTLEKVSLDPFEFEILLEIKELKEPVVEQPTSNKNKKSIDLNLTPKVGPNEIGKTKGF